ncbi:polysaccharide deacetylase [Paenibacillus albiflavus]|uniref:Polysaccharide deacetylase n=1 Tax=Paenibacillus albiflavus TaxID=2545760 RepID=A0A4R4DY16_9BACL|nr:polysaccharide deacetylase family protein [Paenibacillus albiflavus]TCZ70204.1 polysaccharide deacetylase [Paenibacillus albiflavus]
MLKSLLLFLLLTTNTVVPANDHYENQPIHYQDKALVLMYHEVKNNNGSIAVSTDQFDKHLSMLKANGYNVISIEQFDDFMTGKEKKIPPNAVVLTFDDGYEDFYENAYPILQKYKMPATNFIIVKSTDVYNPDIIPHMTWEQMVEMRKNGMSFYSHTYDSHKYVAVNSKGTTAPLLGGPIYLPDKQRVETQEEYYDRIKEDLSKANDLLNSKLGNTRNIISFPYGSFSDTTIQVSKELDMHLYITIKEGINKPGDPVATRINAGKRDFSAEELLAKMKEYDDPSTAPAATK